MLMVEETLRGLADRFSEASHAVHMKLARAYSGDAGPTYQDVMKEEK